ncbi:uroporphyrinogen-III synthase, partial [Stomatohabitans albus]
YELPPGVAEDLAKGRIDAVACSSSSTIRNLVALSPDGIAASVKLVAIGPSTAATIEDLGYQPAAIAHRHDVDGLVAALIETLTSA